MKKDDCGSTTVASTDDENARGVGMASLSFAEAQQMGEAMHDAWLGQAEEGLCGPPPFELSDCAWAHMARSAFEELRKVRGLGGDLAAGERSSLAAMSHSLRCMADRAAERGCQGWEKSLGRAAGFMATVDKLVTRLLPRGQAVRVPDVETERMVDHVVIAQSGRMIVVVTDPAIPGVYQSVPALDVEPIFELRAEIMIDHHTLDPAAYAWGGGTVELPVVRMSEAPFVNAEIAEVHHLAVDEQIVHLHGPKGTAWDGFCRSCNSKPCICNIIEQ